MNRSVAVLAVILVFYGIVALSEVVINTENEFEGSLCFVKNGSHGVCRTSCSDDPSGEYRSHICDSDSDTTLYCCVDQTAAQLYPTIHDGCMKRRLAENFDIKKKREFMLLVLKLRGLDETYAARNNTQIESCQKEAMELELEEREKFLEYCQQVGQQEYSTLSGNFEFKHFDEPSMVAIGYFDGDDNIRWICVGYLVHPLYVLTSGHCIREHPYGLARAIQNGQAVRLIFDVTRSAVQCPFNVTFQCISWQNEDVYDVPNVVRFGRDNLYDQDFYYSNVNSAFTYPITQVITSDRYNKDTLAADIALLQIERNIADEESKELHFKPTPACLWTRREPPTENLTIAGYTHVRHQGNVSLTSKSECAKKLNMDQLDDTRACYVCHFPDQGYITPSLLYNENLAIDVPYLVAIGSCGLQCHGDEPAHFTLIYPHLSWIESVISRET